WDAARLADLCDELLRAAAARGSRSLLQLIASVGRRRVGPPLVRGLVHPVAAVRAACARALAGCGADEALRAALADADAEVRLAAIEALPGVAAGDLVPLLRDPDARVRAVAAAR